MTLRTHAAAAGIWSRTWHWLRAFDASAHEDPTDILQRRVDHLERRLRDLEAKT